LKRSKLIISISAVVLVILVPLGCYVFMNWSDIAKVIQTADVVDSEDQTAKDNVERQDQDSPAEQSVMDSQLRGMFKDMPKEERKKMRKKFKNMSPKERQKFIEKKKQEASGDAQEKPSDDAGEPNESSDGLEAINLDNVEMKAIIAKLYDWTGKPIIPTSDVVMGVRVTIHSGKAVTRERALSLIYDSLRVRGVVVEHAGDRIFLKPIAEAKLGSVPTLGPDDPLARQVDRSRIVEKFFRIENYSASKVVMAVTPFVNEYGHITGIESSGTVSAIDTVENLMRIERIIKELDVPESEQIVEEFFEIKHADPIELVGVLELILDTRSRRGGRKASAPTPPGDKGLKLATSITIEASQIPVKLIPIPKQNWIIARGSAEDIKKIAAWIEKLDTDDTVKPEQTTIAIRFADVREVERMVENAIAETPGTELKTSVIVQALPQSRQIVVFGSEENRRLIEDIINEIDQPTSDMFDQRTFILKHADPDQIKENLEALYEQQSGQQGRYRRGRYSNRQVSPADVVKVISYSALNRVTVIASAQNMEEIEQHIKEWDVPLDVSKDQYRIITLRNSDPVKLVELLDALFTEDGGGGGRSFWDFVFGGGDSDREKIVGNLYGMLTFEPVPDTKKIIVISKIPQAYDIIEKLIIELDSQEKAEVPKVITLKYADAEDLCEQLNAILNEPGTQATIRRSKSGLSDYSTDDDAATAAGENTSDSQDTIDFWWNKARNRRDEEMPTSNLIGKIRFIPVHRSKALLVLAPPEYLEDITNMIDALDKPGKQVMVKAVIVEIDHSDMTSLGVQLAASTSAFGSLEENALNVLNALTNTSTRGSVQITTTANVNVLVDLLVKKANARVLNQPTLWTKDNEEAVFMKGQEVPFVEGSQSDNTGTSIKESVKYSDVGVTLRIRPNITPEKAVDMTIDLEISEVANDLVNSQIAVDKLNTTTHVIVDDGETILLGGILFQRDSDIRRKVPLLGDIPVVGGLFSHESTLKRNNELLIFITPYVMDDETTDEAIKQIEEPKKKMQKIMRQMDDWFITEVDDDFADQNEVEVQENTD